MSPLSAMQVQSRAEEDSFATAILDPKVDPQVSDHVIAPSSSETPHLNAEWQRLCRDKGWFCRICNIYPKDTESPLGYEDGLCPEHRLVSRAE